MNEEREHALLSASSAKIWTTCTPAAREAEKYADAGSDFAAEGTAAHKLAELKLRCELYGLAEDYALLEDFKQKSPWYNLEMEEAISDYVSFIFEQYNAALADTRDATIGMEQRLDYSAWAPEGFGTGDVVIIGDGLMRVTDLKYGKGVPVSAIENPQTRLYGLGALEAFGLLYDIDRLELTIYQPRIDNITSETISTVDLLKWGNEYVKPRAQAAWDGTGDFTPGEHCRFCNALPHCKALANYHLELAKYEFRPENEMTIEDLADVLVRGEQLKTWIEKLQAYALDQAVNHGTAYPGWKLVEGRSKRVYVDQDKVARALIKAGYEEAIIYERSLLGITAMEKAIGKKGFALLGDLVNKAPGAPTLAPETDKRAEIGSTQSARSDFGTNEN